jgi:asparagine synthase (glutamine-hydrolysing)
MCGITGFFDAKRQLADPQRLAQAMALAIQHRGPDGADEWLDSTQGVALAHRRLAIVDLSEAGKQPMLSHDGRFVACYNGEIYNHVELRAELEAIAPRAWRGHSDTEVMLLAISQWGLTAALGKMTGMWAIALWDREQKVLHLIRDRMGEKPLYYGYVNGTLCFGSELKTLRAFPGFNAAIDPEAVPLFCRYSAIPAPRSIYQGIYKLTQGTVLSLTAADVLQTRLPEPVAYWSLRSVVEQGYQRPFKGSADEAVEQLDSLLRRAISRQMMADVPVGAFLSGGIDSSAVVALMQDLSPGKVKTFSIGFTEKDYNEAHHAKAVAEHLGTAHTELYVTPQEARGVIPKLAHIYDEPFADSSQIPTYLVSAMTRAHVTVSLSGDAGDELFSGYSRYPYSAQLHRRMSLLPLAVRQGLASVMQAIPTGVWDTLTALPRAVLPAHLSKLMSGAKAHQLAQILQTSDPAGLYQRFISNSDPARYCRAAEPLSLQRDYANWPQIKPYIEQVAALDALTYLPDDILVKVDRAGMAVSLESRVPMLDHELVAYAYSLPAEYKHRDGQSKWPLRQVLFQHVPRAILERPKQGFGVPVGAWLAGPLRDWCEDLLPKSADDPHWHTAAVQADWQSLLAGQNPAAAHSLWNVLMFQAWQRSTNES